MPKLDPRWNRATGIRAMRIRIRAMGIRVMRIRIRVTWIRAMGVRSTWIPGHLRRARMATTPITLTHARPTATMDLAGFRAESLLASGRGGAGVGGASLGDLALAGGATTEARGPFPGAEDFAVGSVTVTPVEADVASVVADVPSMAVDVPSMAVDAASVAVGMPTVEADMAAVEAEAEAVPMVFGAGRFRHNSRLSRPTAFAVGRYRLRLRERWIPAFAGMTAASSARVSQTPDTKHRHRARNSGVHEIPPTVTYQNDYGGAPNPRLSAVLRTWSPLARTRTSSVRFTQRTVPVGSIRNSAGRAMSTALGPPRTCRRSYGRMTFISGS